MHSPLLPGRPFQPSRAFSLLEVAIVLSILALFGSIAAPRFASFLAYQRADAAARRITADLAMAQEHARLSSQSQTIVFDPAVDNYVMPGVEGFEPDKSNYTVSLAEEPYLASIVSADFSGQPDLTIDGFGVPQSNGTIIIRVGNFQRTITVDSNTATPGGGGITKGKVSQ